MIRAVMPRLRARFDLFEQFVYFAEQAGAQLGERYIAAVEKTCLQLAKRPYSGPRYDARVSRLDGLRRFPVSGFSQYVIFYIPRTSVIDVIVSCTERETSINSSLTKKAFFRRTMIQDGRFHELQRLRDLR